MGVHCGQLRFGITPAYAGKRCWTRTVTRCIGDHPRLCGEKSMILIVTVIYARITPAYAGKSFICQANAGGFQDHPRLCGEKSTTASSAPNSPGSPPPMRGKGIIYVFLVYLCRITPAYAGKSTSRLRKCIQRKDHPRLCGEKTKKIPKQRYFFHQPASFSFSLQYT